MLKKLVLHKLFYFKVIFKSGDILCLTNASRIVMGVLFLIIKLGFSWSFQFNCNSFFNSIAIVFNSIGIVLKSIVIVFNSIVIVFNSIVIVCCFFFNSIGITFQFNCNRVFYCLLFVFCFFVCFFNSTIIISSI